ncbi:tripartite motif-containing protein 16-like [Cyprinodon tularosa]|uniref:tripartite motif-containing protein 16-like n=1 Tax=Cyprinodon tularosa TaxID=77115 RepID=UPI0018E23A0E|nr:tripartite motif-containing protein 16-like [Cyprinodon tularosa]
MGGDSDLSCLICSDLLKDLVNIPCGHSYCKTCIKDHWDGESLRRIFSCPQCRKESILRSVLEKSVMSAALGGDLKESELQARAAGPEDVACDICCIRRKMKAIKSCLVCLLSFCEDHLQPHHDVPGLKQHKLGDPSKKLQEIMFSRHNEAGRMFCSADQQCICHVCTIDKHKDHEKISPAAAERFKKQEERYASLWRPEFQTREEFLEYSRELTLDPNTAHNKLVLSEGNRKVTRMKQKQSHSYHPNRFSLRFMTLSRESLTGRCYWEVECTGGRVHVAVSYKNISRVQKFGWDEKSWSLYCHRSGYTFYHKKTPIPLPGPVSSRIGVYLDHRAGILSFYSVSETMTLLYRVQTTFTQPLYAGVWPLVNRASAELVKLK